MMNTEVLLKTALKRIVGRYHPIYRPSREMAENLEKLIPTFMRQRLSKSPPDKKLLLAGMGSFGAHTEAIYAKTLEDLGYEAHVLTHFDPFIERIFAVFGIRHIYFYEDYLKNIRVGKIKSRADALLHDRPSADFLNMLEDGVPVGKYAAASFMRLTRRASFDLEVPEDRSLFRSKLIDSLSAGGMADSIVKEIEPDLVFVTDRGYTPVGQLFDTCMHRGIPVIQRIGSHKSGMEILKRYSVPGKDTIHPQSLSEASWKYVRNMPWDDSLWHEVSRNIRDTYLSGDWFSEVGTQFNKMPVAPEALISRLALDPKKKTAVIFPHMFWDATFFWGTDLFRDYYDWFVNVLKVAGRNTQLNWIVKIHPANVVKAKRDHYTGENVELRAIYDTLGKVPDHMKIIPPESDINTMSLLEVMDYCLTVRGTIGIEASAFGVPTLTAGTGRYDHLGFTRDFDSAKDYLDCLEHLQDLPPMSREAVTLARRYAYGVFMMRPIRLDLLDYGYNNDAVGSIRFRPLFETYEEFEKYGFVREWRNFVSEGQEDYLYTGDVCAA